ncbi:1-phosphatidylinositol phosphodiesterase [Rhynchospora pubera]|uniref:1-phosphatidylinositol phosphodiesterase n=1 Tax=Rhynchospora pubera TaxID=906938 RepID=A0AAV8ESW0_9POAL|nr:1-phosphatidylinositol phosphodiesterase [Rhynchospora pubera]KAJ4783784.1 1-phosphatidylinositol phosphodiesterase [Rhynchospora pubera]
MKHNHPGEGLSTVLHSLHHTNPSTTMGAQISLQKERRQLVTTQKQALQTLLKSSGEQFPGSDYHPSDRKNWMEGLGPDQLRLYQVVWPGTHDSATNKIGIRFVSRPFAQCQNCSIYKQLVKGTRVLDIRVRQDKRVCHGILATYSVDVVINDVKKFLGETKSEIIILEIRTEFGQEDPPEFDKYLNEQLGDYLIPQDDAVFHKTIAEILPKRVICVWKPRKTPAPKPGDTLWNGNHLKDNWIDTDLPEKKFESNMNFLSQQPPVKDRRYFYRVENTATPQADNPIVCVKPVTGRIHGFARLFIAQAIAKGIEDRLQIFSTDFIDEDFVDACAGLTHARIEGKAPA